MDAGRWRRLEELFHELIDVGEPERGRRADAACGDDRELRGQLVALLAYASFDLEPETGEIGDIIGAAADQLARDRHAAAIGKRLGPYRLVSLLGTGGMGAVYLAERDDAEFARQVAIKLVLHATGSPQAVARFKDERQILAALDHPNIVRLLDGGSTDDDLPYLVMELVDGQPITAYARTHALSVRARVQLIRVVCTALQYAHQHLIVHRDIKPSNILVDATGTPKLLDFGVAKLLEPLAGFERQGATRTGVAPFTPEYASPEQARGEAVSTATDVYSLGAVLYELLTDQPPHRATGNLLEMIRVICEVDPVRPSLAAPPERRRELVGDLDNIVQKALHVEPARRYASIEQLADDLDRYLDGLPVLARTATVTYRARKFLRRNRTGAITAALVAASTAAIVGAVFATRRAAAPVRDRGGSGDACVPGTRRLVGVWDPPTRAAIAARFAATAGPEVAPTWRVTNGQLDRDAARWATAWDDACAADRATDPLLHAQRQTCLEGVLLELRGRVNAVATIPVQTYIDGGWLVTGLVRTLDDCADPAVLRAQVPAPAPAIRERVSNLLLDAYHATVDSYAADDARSGEVDHDLDRVDTIARQLEALDRPTAAIPILLRADLVAGRSWDYAARLPSARAALTDAIRRIEASRDDFAIAGAHLLEAAFELALERDGDRVARATEALTRSEAAVARAGGPRAERRLLAERRVLLAIARGRFDDAVVGTREATALALGDDPLVTALDNTPGPGSSITTLARAGQTREAIEAATALVAEVTAGMGEDHIATIRARLHLSLALDEAGDVHGAHDQAARITTIFGNLVRPPYRLAWARAREHDLALQAGLIVAEADAAAAEATAHGLDDLGTTPPHQSGDGPSTARRAGHFELFALAVDRESARAAPGERSDLQLDRAAALAFARGDDARMTSLAAIMARRCARAPCSDWLRVSRWLAVLADAAAGRDGAIADRLAALEAEYGGDHVAVAASGMVLARLGRWTDARAVLERARALPDVWERQADLLEVDAWLGLARRQTGDAAGARAALEEALDVLSISYNGFRGFSYMTPVAELALADLLWTADVGDDRDRARRLAARAADDFVRLGPLRDPDRRLALRWLADHPPAPSR